MVELGAQLFVVLFKVTKLCTSANFSLAANTISHPYSLSSDYFILLYTVRTFAHLFLSLYFYIVYILYVIFYIIKSLFKNVSVVPCFCL